MFGILWILFKPHSIYVYSEATYVINLPMQASNGVFKFQQPNTW